MSDPSRHFRRLSINANKVTGLSEQAYAEDIASVSSQDSDSDTEGADSSEQEPMAQPLVFGKSGLKYDLTILSPRARKRAASSITTGFKVQRCSATPDSFVFEINDPLYLVSLQSDGMTCECSEYTDDGGKACRHIFWLLDQLYSQTVSPTSFPDIPLSPSGPSPIVEDLHTFLSKSTIDRLAQRLEWPTGPSTRQASPSTIPTRAVQVRDILSTFARSVLPSKCLVQEFANINRSRTPEECNVPLDLEATVFRLAVNDLAVFNALTRTQPPAARAEIFYSKVRRLAAEAIKKVDSYVAYGPSSITESSASRAHQSSTTFLAATARELQESVRYVSAGISVRAPLGLRSALECLLLILNEANARNYDMLLDITWERSTPLGEEDWQRNFWEWCLRDLAESEAGSSRAAGKRPSDVEAMDEEEEFFVLDTLMKLPAETLGEKAVQLRTMQERMENQDVDHDYLTRFQEVIDKATSAEIPQTLALAHSRMQSRAPTPRIGPREATSGVRGASAAPAARGRGRRRGGDTSSRAGQKRPASSAGGDAPKRGGQGGRRSK